MKICPNCGTHLKGNEVFCPNCGYDLSKSSDQKTNQGNEDSDDQIGLDSYFKHLEQSMEANQAVHQESGYQSLNSDDSFAESDQKSSASSEPLQSSSAPQSNYKAPRNDVQETEHHQVHSTTINYFNWWWQTICHPASQITGSWYFGLISFVISCLLWILSFRSLMGRFNALIDSFFGGRISIDNAMFESADQSWWGLIIIGLLAWLSSWFLGYGFRKLHHEIDFWQYGNQLAALTNLALPLSLIMLILAELGLVPLAIICFFAIVIVSVVGLAMSIIIPDRNKLYLAMLAVGLVPLIVIVVFTCIVQIIG